ncbi:MAG: hypothetical protein J6A04_07210 [Clostridia bacterium]|nr:hypothetical protein [Clostridia bacterium]
MVRIIYNFGDNIISVKVVAKDGVTDKEYTIKLYKTTLEEENRDVMLLKKEENQEAKKENKITAGQIVFIIIIAGSTAGVIYMLIRKYRIER